MTALWQDVRHGLRVLLRHPGRFGLAAACLALGIGMNTTMFSSADPWLFSSLPYRQPERLVLVREAAARRSGWQPASVPSYFRWRAESTAVAEWGAYVRVGYNLSTEEEPERIQGAAITASLFPLLGVAPSAGRAFSAEEDRPGGPRACLVGHALWQRRFGGDRGAALGRTLTIDGAEHVIVGIMPPGWAFPEYAEVWTPLAPDPGDADRSMRRLDVLARLRPSVSAAQAQAELEAVARRDSLEHPESSADYSVRVRPLAGVLTPPAVRAALVLMLVAAGLVLLIACANVGTLMLAQAIDRRQEFATRLALGASPARVVRQLFAEALVLALVGGAAGLALASRGMAFTNASIPVRPPFWALGGLSLRALAVTVACCVFAALATGLAPALEAARFDLRSTLQEGGRGAAGGARSQRLGSLLVAAELALALVLLAGAGLMVRSFWARQQADLGFAAGNTVTASLSLSGERYHDAAQRTDFVEELLRRARALPRVEAAAIVSTLPVDDELGGGWSSSSFEVDGELPAGSDRPRTVSVRGTTECLAALGVALVRGRAFRPDDAREAVAVVSDDLAQRHWAQGDAVGRRVRLGDGPWLTVVGVARATTLPTGVLGAAARPPGQIYVPYASDAVRSVKLVVRGPDAEALAPQLRHVVRGLDPALPLYALRTLDDARRRSDWLAELWGRLLAWAAAGALLLTCTGVYGVVSRSVARRTQEIGVRMALGASPRAVLGLVLGQGLRLALAGVGVGLVGALVLTRSLASLLYGVSPSDPATLAGGAVALTAVALLATLVPAIWATRVEPTTALRTE